MIVYTFQDCNYIGSTQNSLRQRQREHKSRCHNANSPKYNFPVYQYIRANNLPITLIPIGEFKECSTRIQRVIEQYFINLYDSVNNGLNDRNAFNKKYNKINKKRRRCQAALISCGNDECTNKVVSPAEVTHSLD